jgi:hypothetical protein
MPELWFEVYCGICGAGVCYDTTVKDQTLTVACHKCKEKISTLQEKLAVAKKKKGKKGCK